MANFLIAAPTGAGSVAAYFSALALELLSRSHNACYLAPLRDVAGINQPPGLPVHEWPSERPTRFADAVFLLKLLRSERPDYLMANFAAVNLCMVLGAIRRVPCRVAWYHTLSTQLRIDYGQSGLRQSFQKRRKRFVYGLATRVIANSGASASDLKDTYHISNDKCSVLHLLIPEPERPNVGRTPNRLVCVGRFHPSKGQQILIQALKIITTRFPDVSVEFLGGGPSLDDCKDTAAKIGVSRNCQFRGPVPISEVFTRVASSAICVSPSLDEALGLVNIEAQAVGTPVVASAVGGIRDVVVDGQTGFLVAPGSPEALAEKIGILLRNQDMREKFGAAAREHFLAKFSTRNIGSHADFFESLLSAGHKRTAEATPPDAMA